MTAHGNATGGVSTEGADRPCGGDTDRSLIQSWRSRGRESGVNGALTPDPLALAGLNSGWVRPGSRLDRASAPRAKQVLRDVAVEFGICVRPILLRRTDLDTGASEIVETPCESTRDKVCPPCARKARALRAQQCREGWHLDVEPDLTPAPGAKKDRGLVEERAQLVQAREDAIADAKNHPGDTAKRDLIAVLEDAIADLDTELGKRGVKGRPEPSAVKRRARSTRRRHDVPDLPRVASNGSSLGRTYLDPVRDRVFRPSMFLTVTLDSYGAVDDDGTPMRVTTYDYAKAARDALHFGKLLDRLIQNLRRVAGYELQYFAVVEEQKRLAPHAHFAIRGTLPRAVVKQAVAATYANVWWPSVDTVVYDGAKVPVWDPDVVDPGTGEVTGGYVDPGTREPLPTWREALDRLDEEHAVADETGERVEPLHCVRFGPQVDVKGVLPGSPDAGRLLGYLVKYLVKDLGDDLGDVDEHTADPVRARLDRLDPDLEDTEPAGGEFGDGPGFDGFGLDEEDSETSGLRRRPRTRTAAEQESAAARADHRARLVHALRFEPCSKRCTNWLRYGIQPHGARPGMRPGSCKGKAHRPSHVGYGGRRVLVSRKWTGKDLPDHRADRKTHVLATLGATDELRDHLAGKTTGKVASGGSIAWEKARPNDPDVAPAATRVYLAVARAIRQRGDYEEAKAALERDVGGPPDLDDRSATDVQPAA